MKEQSQVERYRDMLERVRTYLENTDLAPLLRERISDALAEPIEGTAAEGVVPVLVRSIRRIEERANAMKGRACPAEPTKAATNTCAWIASECRGVLDIVEKRDEVAVPESPSPAPSKITPPHKVAVTESARAEPDNTDLLIEALKASVEATRQAKRAARTKS